MVWIISLSLKDPTTIGDGNFFPSKFTTANYSSIFKQSIFTDALRNSIGIALISTVLAVFIACFAAYAIARLDFPGKNVLLLASLAIAMFPPISLVGPLYNLWRNIGLYDTWPGLIIPYMTFALPLSIFVLSTFFREIPWELEQAAQVDGATPYQAFVKVIAPLAAPGIFTTGHPGLHDLLERLRVRVDADVDQLGRDGARGDRGLPGRLAVHRANRHDRGGRRGRHDPGHHHRARVPAPDRRRPDRGRRQGIRRALMAEIALEHITKRYGDGFEAVKDLNLDVSDGEFMILVGPSGCGKSTALRMVAGLEDITGGELKIGGKLINDRAPKDRDIAMVFQNYALYPHMTVRENMGFALKLAKTPEAEINQKVVRGREDPRPRAAPGPQAGQPLRRPAPARGHGPRHRPQPERVPDGRAAVQPRRQAARPDAHRDRSHPAAL